MGLLKGGKGVNLTCHWCMIYLSIKNQVKKSIKNCRRFGEAGEVAVDLVRRLLLFDPL